MPHILERLAAPPVTTDGRPEAFDREAAVAAQIRRIVTARPLDPYQDEAALHGFGMPSVVELSLGSAGQLERYAARLERQIALYEPRLLAPSVTLAPAGGALAPWSLVVTGLLAPDREPVVFRFDFSGS